ncbi:MAG: alanine racemase [Acidimicrobiia bacterium]|nr:alanine racemase [Acidimicrobiia bacterium]
MRPSWIEIDVDAIKSNARVMSAAIAPAALCAVVKADGYGHGDVPSAEAALAGGASWLAVALVEEGVRLREAGIEAPILLLSEPADGDTASIVRWNLHPTVYTPEFADALGEAVGASTDYPVHLKLNTGMHRVGVDPVNAFSLARKVAGDPRLTLEGLWTHFAVAEEDVEYTRRQTVSLLRFRETLAAEGIEPVIVHAANTAGGLLLGESRFDMVRAGLGIYGLRPGPEVGTEEPLRPAMRVVSQVAFLRTLPAGERPSYGRRRALGGRSLVATVPIGYADGVPRRLSDIGEVLIRGKRYPLAGAITMDQIVVDIGEDEVAVGDEVVLLGDQGEESITADEWASKLDTINYEIVCGFGPRLPRRYRGAVDGQ